MKRLLLFMALCSVLLAPASVLAQELQTIYDARLELKSAALSASEDALLKQKVLPAAGRQWHDLEVDLSCEQGFSPMVIDVARGSFTRPNSDQKAILYRYCETGHNMALNGIAVIENGSVATHLIYSGDWENAIAAIPDIDGDGRSKILVSTGGTDQGITWGAVRIIELSDTIVLTKYGMTRTLFDDCGFDEKNGRATAWRLRVKAGPTPVFYRQHFVNKGACVGAGTWKKMGKPEKFSLENDETDYQFVR